MPLDKLDGVARFAAGHAMPEAFVRGHDEVGRLVVVMKGTAPDPVFYPVLLQLDAPALHEGHQVGLAFDALNVGFGYAPGHGSPPGDPLAALRVVFPAIAIGFQEPVPAVAGLFW